MAGRRKSSSSSSSSPSSGGHGPRLMAAKQEPLRTWAQVGRAARRQSTTTRPSNAWRWGEAR
eukprot:1108018-Lingulodinium_polyedra.AAC.1